MGLDETVLKSEEHVMLELRALYKKYGYSQFKMSKFEEYDLYVRNKDFLVGDGVITFTDTDGKLLALKPDVTLSIIQNSKDMPGVTQKVYYNENVYRISGSTHTFKEIMQTGLECIGDIDVYSLSEVVMLAAKSLAAVSGTYLLDLSHMGIVSPLVDAVPASQERKAHILRCIGEKNVHEIREICRECAAPDALAEKLALLVGTYGRPEDVFPVMRGLCTQGQARSALHELESVVTALGAAGLERGLHIDFSVVNDMNYYSGIVFRGFVDGVPEGILSGGQYDGLMHRMGRKSGAAGFAVYLDLLERLPHRPRGYDADPLWLYEADTDVCELMKAVGALTGEGSVLAEKTVPEGIEVRRIVRLRDGRLEILEQHD